MLQVKNIKPLLEKIALSLSTTQKSSFKTKSSSGFSDAYRSNDYGRADDRNLQDTLSEARTNADLQPLNKKISKPKDFPTTRIKAKKNVRLSHLVDRRLLNKEYNRSSRSSSLSPALF